MFNLLGKTGLSVSGTGFGCYRVNVGTPAHEQALRKALNCGINLIDTSANYADGGSERLVGQVIGEMITNTEITRDQIVVVSKGGYIQSDPDLAEWIPNHEKTLQRAFRAVASIYADEAIALERRIILMVEKADPDWAGAGSLSQKAIGALISTAGVSAVLVGMRKDSYVSDVLTIMKDSANASDRTGSWNQLSQKSGALFDEN